MTRTEHLEWCKKRALDYVDQGDLGQAFAAMAGDMREHPETRHHPAIGLGVGLMIIGELDTPEEMRKFIEGFN